MNKKKNILLLLLILILIFTLSIVLFAFAKNDNVKPQGYSLRDSFKIFIEFINSPNVWSGWDCVSSLILFLSMLLALAGTIYFIYMIFFQISRPRYEQANNYIHFFVEQYLDGEIKIETEKGEKRISFKEIRLALEDIYKKNRKFTEEGKKKYDILSKKSHTLENKFAYRISIVLNRIGISVLSGIIPLHMVLSLNGNQILQDWEYCRELIKGKISYNLFKKEDKNKLVNMSRRHFLWLVCASSLYMYKNWTTLTKKKIEEQKNWIKKVFDREDLNIRELIKMNNEIMIIIEKAESNIIPRLARRDIKNLRKGLF